MVVKFAHVCIEIILSFILMLASYDL